MSKQQAIANSIANHVRKLEELQNMQANTLSLIQNETACLHKCLSEGAKLLKISIDKGDATIFGGGTPKKDTPG
ncbi:MAG: hypothetical protein KUG64_11100 [Cycloclasticus sp.]|nr:hypothetical protein [Cycloclasticus sp.]